MFKKWVYLAVLLVCVHGYSLEWNRFEWGKSNTAWNSSEQLKERWVNSLLQECMRSKLEKELIGLGVEYSIQSEEGWLSCRLFGFFQAEAGSKIESLERVKQGYLPDFSSELEVARAFWGRWIQDQSKGEIHPDWLRQPPFESSFSYGEFLERSAKILQELSVDDLLLALEDRIEKQPLERNSFFAVREGFAAHSSFIPAKKGWEPAPGSGRGGEPKSEEAQLFFNLPLTDQDRSTIRQIVTAMADKNVIQLLLDKKSMERKGDLIQPVHPLRFAGYVLTDPILRRCMKTVSKSTFKWNGFLDGYEKRLKEESRAGTLNCYVPGLADLLEVDRSVIQRYINQENYSGLIKHFL